MACTRKAGQDVGVLGKLWTGATLDGDGTVTTATVGSVVCGMTCPSFGNSVWVAVPTACELLQSVLDSRPNDETPPLAPLSQWAESAQSVWGSGGGVANWSVGEGRVAPQLASGYGGRGGSTDTGNEWHGGGGTCDDEWQEEGGAWLPPLESGQETNKKIIQLDKSCSCTYH